MTDIAQTDEGRVEEIRGDSKMEAQTSSVKANDRISIPSEWRRIAQLMEQEKDPAKLMDLAQKLIEEFDRIQGPGLPALPHAAEPPSVRVFEEQQEDASPQG